jgi:glycosyltransferase involved in cell wall biosynthesis
MKKILFINGSNVIGGGELSLVSIAKSFTNSCVLSFDYGPFTELLKKEKISSIVPTSTKSFLSIKKGHSISSLFAMSKSIITSIFEARRIIKDYDIVYCNSQKGIIFGITASFFLKKTYIIHIRDMLDNPRIPKYHKLILKYLIILKKPIIIANSKATANSLRNIGINNNINVIYNGIKPSVLYNKKTEKFIVAMFSRISPWKGQKEFIEAAQKIDDPGIEYWIVGDALFGEDNYKQEILDMVKNTNLEDRIKFLGYVKDPLNYMQNIDVLVLPSIEPEPFGRVVIEAMFLKKVVVATNMGGPTEIIDDEKDGLLIDTENIVLEIVEKIYNLRKNPSLYQKLSENAYSKAHNNFTESLMLSKIHNIVGI